jgi:hypothetical protein
MKNILISGCSYTQPYKSARSTHWTTYLFPDQEYQVTNLATGSAGNRYIASSILSNIDLSNKPDYVFVLWSGVRRIDMPFRKEEKNLLDVGILTSSAVAVVDNVKYFLVSGNTRMFRSYVDFELEGFKTIEEYNRNKNLIGSDALQSIVESYFIGSNGRYNVENSDKFCNQLSLESISSVTNFLDNHKIEYNFSFIYNLHSNDLDFAPSFGPIDKQSNYYNHINWDRYIDTTPFEYGVRHDLLNSDNWHLTPEGMCQWADEIQSRISILAN